MSNRGNKGSDRDHRRPARDEIKKRDYEDNSRSDSDKVRDRSIVRDRVPDPDSPPSDDK